MCGAGCDPRPTGGRVPAPKDQPHGLHPPAQRDGLDDCLYRRPKPYAGVRSFAFCLRLGSHFAATHHCGRTLFGIRRSSWRNRLADDGAHSRLTHLQELERGHGPNRTVSPRGRGRQGARALRPAYVGNVHRGPRKSAPRLSQYPHLLRPVSLGTGRRPYATGC